MNENKINTKNKYGQYFTPEDVAKFMVELSDKNKNNKVLEPSCGEGVFLKILTDLGFNNISAFEIDKSLSTNYDFVKYESFVTADIKDSFDLIIGNPPYIRWKNLELELKNELSTNLLWNTYFNSLCDYLYIFILKSIELLNNNGELIFICPEYWMNTTHSLSLRNYMVKNGYFTDIYHFNETPIFDNASVSIIIFKYIKSKKIPDLKINVLKYLSSQKLNKDVLRMLNNRETTNDIKFIEVSQFKENERWILASDQHKEKLMYLEDACQIKDKQGSTYSLFDDSKKTFHKIGDFCDIGNGMVSGLDKAFQFSDKNLNNLESESLIKVIKAKNLQPFKYDSITNYIFLKENEVQTEEEFRIKYPSFYKHLQPFKEKLLKRYNYNRDIKYWEWVFLRNYNLFSKKDNRIFVPCKERVSNKDFFRFSFVEENIYPTQDVTALFKKDYTKEDLLYILAYLNSDIVFEWLISNGIIKGSIVEFSEKPISSIPYRVIDWSDDVEKSIHDQIVRSVQNYINNPSNKLKSEINTLINKLIVK